MKSKIESILSPYPITLIINATNYQYVNNPDCYHTRLYFFDNKHKWLNLVQIFEDMNIDNVTYNFNEYNYKTSVEISNLTIIKNIDDFIADKRLEVIHNKSKYLKSHRYVQIILNSSEEIEDIINTLVFLLTEPSYKKLKRNTIINELL